MKSDGEGKMNAVEKQCVVHACSRPAIVDTSQSVTLPIRISFVTSKALFSLYTFGRLATSCMIFHREQALGHSRSKRSASASMILDFPTLFGPKRTQWSGNTIFPFLMPQSSLSQADRYACNTFELTPSCDTKQFRHLGPEDNWRNEPDKGTRKSWTHESHWPCRGALQSITAGRADSRRR